MRVPLVALFAAALAAACGDGSPTCGEPTCDDFAQEPDFVAGNMDAVPDDFPAAPGGAELCGQATGPTVYFVTDHVGEIHDYYHDALTAAGWTTVGPVAAASASDAGPGCESEQGFTMGDPFILVHVYRGGAYSLALRNLDQ